MRPAVDSGSCFSRAVFLDGETFTLVKDPATGSYALPCAAFVTPQGEILVGEEANSAFFRDLTRYRRNIRRYLGNLQPLIDRFLPEVFISRMLQHHKQIADILMRDMNHPPFTGAVITVPATYQEEKRRLMREAASKGGFIAEEITLLDEPIAAAHYYDREAAMRTGERLLIYDLGGTFKAALLEKSADGFVYLTDPLVQEQCGGIRFDQTLYAALMNDPTIRKMFQAIQNSETMQLASLQVREACVSLKHQLSTLEEAEVSITVPGVGEQILYRLSREAFYQMIAPMVQETISDCRQMLSRAHLISERIDRILLAGGSCTIAYVQEQLQRAFNRSLSIAPALDLVICKGAAYYAASHQVYVVSPDGNNGAFTTVSEALTQAETGSRIVVRPGIYREDLEIDSSIEIVGMGSREETIIEGTCEIDMGPTDRTVLQRLSLRVGSPSSDEVGIEDIEAVVTVSEGELVLDNCLIDVVNNIGVYVEGPGQAILRYSQIHTDTGMGIVITEEGKGILEDCQVIGKGQVIRKTSNADEDLLKIGTAGVVVQGEGSSVHIKRCQSHGHMMEILVAEEGQALIEDCVLYGGPQYMKEARQMRDLTIDVSFDEQNVPDCCIGITEEGCRVTIRRSELYHHLVGILVIGQSIISTEECYLHDCQSSVILQDGGYAEMARSKLYDHWMGVAIAKGGRCFMKNCDIARSEAVGVSMLAGDSNANLIDCEIHDGKSIGVWIASHGHGSIAGCKFYRNEGPSIKVQQGSVEVERSHIHKGKYIGISISGKGVARLKNCQIFGEAGVGVRVSGEGSEATMRECTLKGQHGVGVVIEDNGKAFLWFCQFDEHSVKLYIEPGSSVDGDYLPFGV
jgi:hypothetical protein